MDDEQFRQAKRAISSPVCVYEKALQYGFFKCENASVTQLGERQVVSCTSSESCQRCEKYLGLSLQHAGFAIGRSQLPAHLPFNQAMKVQIGGLQGLLSLLGMEASCSVAQILLAAEREYTSLNELNFSKIVPLISSFTLSGRGRSTKRKRTGRIDPQPS